MTIAPRSRRWRDLHTASKGLLLLFCLALTFVGLETISRLYWQRYEHVPFFDTGRVWQAFYPEWDAAGIDGAAEEPGTFRVLLLGGSVLTDVFGCVGAELKQGLEERLSRPVRIYNLAGIGHTTLDNLWKYEHLQERRFDLVVIYEGINDVFLNSCPPGVFRADYSHATRYAKLRAVAEHPEVALFCLPFTVHSLLLDVLDRPRLCNRPRRAWHYYGNDLKTPPSFEHNMVRMLELARQRGDRVVLLTFAYHIPPNYSEAAFFAHQLDYGRHVSHIELWGTPGNVARAIDAHNAIVRDLAKRYGVTLVDLARVMPRGKAYFNDVCHLTEVGCRRFVAHILARLMASRNPA